MDTRTYSAASSHSYTPTEPGRYRVKAYVKDAGGNTVGLVSAFITVE